MAAPVALFNFRANFLEVTFEDLSSNVPTAWVWDFGDASPVSNLQNPVHTYAATGMYKIILTASNVDGSSVFSYWILVSTDPITNQTVEQMVRAVLPADFEISDINLSQAVARWQLYLRPKVHIPYAVAEADMFDQSKWPSLANILISKLIIWELFLSASKKTIITSSGGSSTSSTSSSSGGVTGAIKRIESGPSIAEWFNPASTVSQTIKNSNSAANGAQSGNGGIMTQDLCLFAKRIQITLPDICPKKIRTILPGVTRIS